MGVILRKVFVSVLSMLMLVGMARADIMSDCMGVIEKDPNFSKIMTEEIFPDAKELTQDYVTQRKSKIMGLLAGEVLVNCVNKIGMLVKQSTGKVVYERDNKKYGFTFKVPELFQYMQIPVGIMVYDKVNLGPGDVIKKAEAKRWYWSEECSDHAVWDNLDDDAAVNAVGQKVFSQYGGTDNEFFMDFPDNDVRAFPGLILMDETGSTKEHLVSFNNLHTAVEAAQSFANGLKGGACARDGLAVYVVSTKVRKQTTGEKKGWAITAGVTGGAMALLGYGASALAASTAVAATGSMVLVDSVLAVASVPVYGWIAAGIIVAAVGAISLIPGKLDNVEQVMVLDGPYMLN